EAAVCDGEAREIAVVLLVARGEAEEALGRVELARPPLRLARRLADLAEEREVAGARGAAQGAEERVAGRFRARLAGETREGEAADVLGLGPEALEALAAGIARRARRAGRLAQGGRRGGDVPVGLVEEPQGLVVA